MKNFDNDFTLPPFPAFPCVSRYVPVGTVAESLDRIARSISAHEALVTVIGPPGTGKSLLCNVLAQRFADTHDVVVLGETPISDEKTLYRQLMNRLGVAMENHVGEDVQITLENRINGPSGKHSGLLLVVDESQSLSRDVLESIRLMTNIMREGQPRVTAIMVGGVKFDETLADPALSSFAQRIATRCYLHPMNADETRTYVRSAIEQCGAEADETISAEAIAAVHHAASGVPRLVNQMLTEAIDCAAESNELMIDESIVDRAWAKLQQLPSPIIDEPKLAGESSVVEFGTLEDSDSPMEFRAEQPLDDGKMDESQSDISWQNDPPVPEDIVEEELTLAEPCDLPSDDLTFAEPTAEAMPLPAAMFSNVILDQAANDPVDSKQLFGEFDQEEDISVNKVSPSHDATETNHCSKDESNSLSEPMSCDSTLSVESMIHSEIIGMGNFAADSIKVSAQHLSVGETIQESLAQSDIEEMVDQNDVEPDSHSVSDTAPSVVWYDEPEEIDTKRYEDDSDIVLISETVPVQTTPQPFGEHSRIDKGETRLNVDYQEILAKMRGSKAAQ